MGEVIEMRGVLRLGDILLEQQVINEQQLEESLLCQRETGARLGEAVVALGYATPDQIAAALSWQGTYGLSALYEVNAAPGMAALLTERFCRARLVLPVRVANTGTLLLGMVDTSDIVTLDDVRLITGMEVRPVPISAAGFEEAANLIYSQSKRLESSRVTEAESENGEKAAREQAEYEGVISLVDDILAAAVRQGASDVHFEPQADGTVVRARIDGVLQHLAEVSKEIKDGVVSRVKIIGDMDIAEKRLPQDGRATFHLDDRSVDLRIATVPTVFGENVTVRLLDDKMMDISLERLGMGSDDLAAFRLACSRPWGEVLITGPTGSGKSTTLYAGLEELNRPGVKIYTVEDPVERVIPGILQSQVRPNIGLTFASALRSLVRSDPDVIMIGEIRDRETAQIAAEASLTGHLVFSTLHTNDAISAVTRLLEMGLPPYLISSTLVCVAAQRLARRLCPRCKRELTVNPQTMSTAERSLLGNAEVLIARSSGCNKCFNTGYRGRIGLFEVMPIDGDFRQLIMNGAGEEQLSEYATGRGMRTLREDGRLKVLAGLTTAEEVDRLTRAV